LHSAMMTIRQEQTGDVASIYRVHHEAFGRSEEADLVDTLRSNEKFKLSLVAELEGQVVGHILFTGVTIEGAGSRLNALGLAPLAVLTQFQRKGVGSALVWRGLDQCRDMGHDAIVVLGHPEYYPKFGFLPASRYGLRCEFDVPEGVFMALELREGTLQGIGGLVRYQPEFRDA
jgi:putative acetyltransferase